MSQSSIKTPALQKEIKEYENKVAFLKAEIKSKSKLLDQMQSIQDKSTSENIVHMLQRQEEEILVRDKQIIALNQRLEKLDNGGLAKELSQKDKAIAQLEKVIRGLENDKVELVEQSQEIKIELERKDKLHSEEIEQLKKKIDEWSEINIKLEKNIQDYQEEISEKQQEIDRLKSELMNESQTKTNFQEKLDLEIQNRKELEQKYLQIVQTIDELKKANAQLFEDKKSLESQKNSEEYRVLDLQKEIKQLNDKLQSYSALDRESAKAKEVEQQLKSKVNELNRLIDKQQSTIEEKDKNITNMHDTIEKLNGEISELASKRQKLETDADSSNEDFKGKIASYQAQLDDKDQQIKNYQERIESLENSLNMFKQQAQISNRNEEQEALIDQLKNELNIKLKMIDELNSIIIQNKAEIANLKDQLNRIESEANSLRVSQSVQDKLDQFNEQNLGEIQKLKDLLQEEQEKHQSKIDSLIHYEQRLREMEQQNKEFEDMTKSLKELIKEIQDKMDMAILKSDDLARELELKEEELNDEIRKSIYQDKKLNDLNKEVHELKDALSQKNKELIKKDQSQIKMMDEINLLRKRAKEQSIRLNRAIQDQTVEYDRSLKEKDTEVDVLKEMLKSSKTVIRMRESELDRMKKNYDLQKQSQQLPKIKNPGVRDSVRRSDNFRHQGSLPNAENVSTIPTTQANSSILPNEQLQSYRNKKSSLIIDAEDAFSGLNGAQESQESEKDIPKIPISGRKETDFRDLSFLSQQPENSHNLPKPKQQFRSIQDDALDGKKPRTIIQKKQSPPRSKPGSNIFDPRSENSTVDPEKMYISPVKVTKSHKKKKSSTMIESKKDTSLQAIKSSSIHASLEEIHPDKQTATFSNDKETI